MDPQFYSSMMNSINPSYNSYDLGLSIATITDIDLTVRRITYSGMSYIARKERPMDLKPKDGRNGVIMIVSKEEASSPIIERITDKILIQTIQEQTSEKIQVTETFDEDFPSILFFGHRTSIYAFTGTFLDTDTFDDGTASLKGQWATGFKEYWKNHLRGSVLAKEKKIALMLVNNEMFEGYPINLNIQTNSMNEYTADFSMSWVITKHDSLLDTESLKDFMFFQDSTELERLFADLIKRQKQLTLIQDFNSYIETLQTEQLWLDTCSIDGTETYFIDRDITRPHRGVDAFVFVKIDNEDGTHTYRKKYLKVRFTEDFKLAITYISNLLSELEEPPSILDTSWTEPDELGIIEFDEDSLRALQNGQVLLQIELDRLSAEYNQLMAELERKL